MFSTTSDYLSKMTLETQKRTSKKLGFVPTINEINSSFNLEVDENSLIKMSKLNNSTFNLVVDENQFIKMTKPFFEDYYSQLSECFQTITENLRRTSIRNLECRKSLNAGFPETLDLPSMDFDPFMWRTYLPQKFNNIVQNNEFVFDSELGNFKIIREKSNVIFGDRIDKIEYIIKLV
jgi:hypothetical protein